MKKQIVAKKLFLNTLIAIFVGLILLVAWQVAIGSALARMNWIWLLGLLVTGIGACLLAGKKQK